MNIRTSCKIIALWILNALVFFARTPRQPIILMYHSFDVTNWKYGVSPIDLKCQLEYLVNNFRVVPISKVVESMANQSDSVEKMVSITIDDGYFDTYSEFFPLAKKYNLPFTLFLTTDLSPMKKLGNLPRPTWTQLKEMVDSGLMTVGVHGHTHMNFTDALKQGQLDFEVETCRNNIVAQLGVEPLIVAYPAGRYNQNVLRRVMEMGFQAGCTTHSGVVGNNSDIFCLPRIGVDRATPFQLFKLRLTPGHSIYMKLIRAVRRGMRLLVKIILFLGKIFRGNNPLAIRLPQSHWDQQFASGYWDFLLDVPPNVEYIANKICELYKNQRPRILDVGCGNGVIPMILKQKGLSFDYVGTDISSAALEKARQQLPEATFVCSGMEETPPISGPFDVVIFSEVLLYGNARKTLAAHSSFFGERTNVIISLYKNWRTWLIWRQIATHFTYFVSESISSERWGSGWRIRVGQWHN